MFIIIIAIISIILLVLWVKFIKVPKLNNINFISGSLGTGKSFLTCRFGLSKFYWRVKMQNFRRKLVYYHLPLPKRFKNKIYNEEDIQFYCDIPYDFDDKNHLLKKKFKLKQFDLISSISQKKKIYHKCVAQQITKDHILRKKRFNYKSVVVFDEISVLIDQFDFDDKIVNEKLNLFFKLFRHETKGGLLIINSQSINDCHFSLKNCLNQYFYIHHKKKLLFGMLLYIQELAYSNDNSVVNVNQGDLEEKAKLKLLWVSKKYFRYYDTYTHSWLTDYCQCDNEKFNLEKNGLKSRDIWTLKLMSSIFDNVPKIELNSAQNEYIEVKKIYEKSYLLKKYKEFEKMKKEVLTNEKNS